MQQRAGEPVLRIGIAGLGVASLNVFPELLAHPRVKIVAGADLRKSTLDQFASQFGGETYSSVEALCASSNVDAVYVLTPNRFHAQHAILAAEHGKHVFCDKPFGLTLKEADAMIAAAARNKVRLLCGHSQCAARLQPRGGPRHPRVGWSGLYPALYDHRAELDARRT